MGLLHPDHLRELAAARPAESADDSRLSLGYLDTIVEGHFRRCGDGFVHFYPYGAFGRRGYVVATPEQAAALRRRARRIGRWSLFATFLIVFTLNQYVRRFDVSWLIIALAVGWIPDWMIARIAYRSLTRGMSRARGANSPIAYWKTMGRTMHPALLLFLALGSLLLPAGCVALHLWTADVVVLAIGLLFLVLTAPAYGIAVCTWLRDRTGDVV